MIPLSKQLEDSILFTDTESEIDRLKVELIFVDGIKFRKIINKLKIDEENENSEVVF